MDVTSPEPEEATFSEMLRRCVIDAWQLDGNTTSLARTPESIWDYFLEENISEFESGNSVSFTPFHPVSRLFGESFGCVVWFLCVGFVFCVCFCFGLAPHDAEMS